MLTAGAMQTGAGRGEAVADKIHNSSLIWRPSARIDSGGRLVALTTLKVLLLGNQIGANNAELLWHF